MYGACVLKSKVTPPARPHYDKYSPHLNMLQPPPSSHPSPLFTYSLLSFFFSWPSYSSLLLHPSPSSSSPLALLFLPILLHLISSSCYQLLLLLITIILNTHHPINPGMCILCIFQPICEIACFHGLQLNPDTRCALCSCRPEYEENVCHVS